MSANGDRVRATAVATMAAVLAGLTGCAVGGGAATATEQPAATATVTVTETVTETVSATPDPALADLSNTFGSLDEEPPPRLRLEVFRDGCGVIRTEADAGVSYHNLQWSVVDRDGFDVLERNAEGETHMRYFSGGTYTVVLESFWDGAYRPVSNEVRISC